MMAYSIDFEDYLYAGEGIMRIEVAQTMLKYSINIKNVDKLILTVSENQLSAFILFLCHSVSAN